MEKTREKILILFEGTHVAYSPTISQLYRELETWYDVTIFTQLPDGITTQKPTREKLIYYDFDRSRVKKYYYRINYSIRLLLGDKKARQFNRQFSGKYKEYFFRFRPLEKMLKQNNYARVISVDIRNLYYCTLLNKESDFLSLELCANERLLPFIDKNKINCVLIQTPERHHYLFPNDNLKTFYIQNAPVYHPISIPADRKGLIYAGTAWEAFGFYHCLTYLRKFNTEQLFVQGLIPPDDRKRIETKYADLIKEKRLILSDKWLENDDMVDFMTQFEIGFCFYDFSIAWINNFNYQTAPSGKLFKYLAAGVPVIGNDIPGFHFVKEYKCGVLVADLEPDTIDKAVSQIRENYKMYAANALKVAERFSFDKAVKPYLDYIRA